MVSFGVCIYLYFFDAVRNKLQTINIYYYIQLKEDQSWDFMLNGRDFHDERSRFSWWTVEIIMMNRWDFHVERSRFPCWTVERLIFSCWTIEIFMFNSRDFLDERSKFSCWTVEIFMLNSWDFYHERRDFHNDRSRIALLVWLKSRCARGASGHPVFSFHPRFSLIYLVDEFFFLLLK